MSKYFLKVDLNSQIIIEKLRGLFLPLVLMSLPRQVPGRVFGVLKGNRRFFSPEDDQILRQLKRASPELSWEQLSKCMPGFTARQLRERWRNYLSPALNTTTWTDADDLRLLDLHNEFGPKWGIIGSFMDNRPAPDIKNRFQLVRNRRDRERRTNPTNPDPPILGIRGVHSFPPPPIHKSLSDAQDRRKAESGGAKPPEDGPGLVDFSIKSLLL
jgi:hypothetical protein